MCIVLLQDVCQAGPDRFTCAMNENEEGVSVHFYSLLSSKTWLHVPLPGYMMADYLKPHDSPGRYTNLCAVLGPDHSALMGFFNYQVFDNRILGTIIPKLVINKGNEKRNVK